MKRAIIAAAVTIATFGLSACSPQEIATFVDLTATPTENSANGDVPCDQGVGTFPQVGAIPCPPSTSPIIEPCADAVPGSVGCPVGGLVP